MGSTHTLKWNSPTLYYGLQEEEILYCVNEQPPFMDFVMSELERLGYSVSFRIIESAGMHGTLPPALQFEFLPVIIVGEAAAITKHETPIIRYSNMSVAQS